MRWRRRGWFARGREIILERRASRGIVWITAGVGYSWVRDRIVIWILAGDGLRREVPIERYATAEEALARVNELIRLRLSRVHGAYAAKLLGTGK